MVSKLARGQVYARFASAWATKLAGIVSGYDAPADFKAKLAAIDWTGASKKQVFRGQINVDQLEATSAIIWPLVILYASDITHDGEEKFVKFSGSCAVNIEFHYTWRKSAALPDFDEHMDLIEGAAIEVLHDRLWIGAISAGLSYRGELTAQRGPVQETGENWAQAIAFRMVLGVDV